jgi:SAM-dependent methyltransferase
VETIRAYSRKAKTYDSYRWDYSKDAISFIAAHAGLGRDSVVADVGAGTGRMTSHLLPICKRVYGLEPNGEMFRLLCQNCGHDTRFTPINVASDRTTLRAGALDAIVAAQAVNWFDGARTKAEFRRILKPNGWLVFVCNRSASSNVDTFLRQLAVSHLGTAAFNSGHPNRISPDAYFDGAHQVRRAFPFELDEDWDHFLGAFLSASWAPDKGDPLYGPLVSELRQGFCRLAHKGYIRMRGETQVIIGRAWRATETA